MNEIIIPLLLPVGLFLGLMIGWLDRRVTKKAYKLSNVLLEHYREANKSLTESRENVSKAYHDLAVQKLDDAMKELEKAANEWEAEKDKNGEPKTLRESVDTLEDVSNKYHELLLAVESKCPGETRHETALRYISEAERRGTSDTKQEKVQNTQSEGDKNV